MPLIWGRGERAFALLFVLQAHTEQDGCKYLHIPPPASGIWLLVTTSWLSLECTGIKGIYGQIH